MKKATKRAKKRGRQSDLAAKAARSVKGGPLDVKGGANDGFAKIGNIKGEGFSIDIGTSERLNLKWLEPGRRPAGRRANIAVQRPR